MQVFRGAGTSLMLWLTDRRRGFPRLARPGLSVHARHQLPPVAAHVGPRQGFPLHHPVHLPGGAPPRQPDHVLHRRPVVLPGDARGDQQAKRSINMECYIFENGKIGRAVHRRAERARAQRRQRHHRRRRDRQLLAVGPAGRAAARGGRPHHVLPGAALVLAAPHQQPHAPRAADRRRHGRVRRRRRHRRLVDGAERRAASGPWRDTMARIEGPIVAALQGVAAENWLECCGEILTGRDYFPDLKPCGETTAFVVKSSPSDRATASRVTFQLLIEGADHTVRIQTPYFLPDRAFRRALVRHGEARRAAHRHRAGTPHRSAVGAPRQPADVGTAARGGHPHLRVPAGDDPRQGPDRGRPLVRDRDDEHRQPIVRAQRRGQRRDAGPGGRGAAARRTTNGISAPAPR